MTLSEQIAILLRQRGTMTAGALQAATGKSQPSVSLALTALGERVCRLGAARSSRYALTREIFGLAATQPLQVTDARGQQVPLGTLTYLDDERVFVRFSRGAGLPSHTWLGEPNKLPWFLFPLRPQGFLGRQYGRLRPDFPSDADQWTAAQVLYLAANHIADPPGAVSLGTVPRSLYPSAPVDARERAQHYDAVTADLRETLPSQSSAGGEQPKFLARVGDDDQSCQHLLVKFSPPHGTPFGERWRSLLHLEALALNTLKAHGISVAASKIITSETRSYLESRRFDRIGREGKRHVVAIDALHEEFVKTPRRNWVHTCEALVAKKLLSRDDLEKVARIYAFGQFIGNSDMHFGNLSFFIDDVAKPSFKLAPVYDMLPMMWRPDTHSGELDATAVRLQPQTPGYANAYAEVQVWAITFWEAAAKLVTLEASLRQGCVESAARLRES